VQEGDAGAHDNLRGGNIAGELAQRLNAERLGDGGVYGGKADLLPCLAAGDLD
jgi:hypothetical protein